MTQPQTSSTVATTANRLSPRRPQLAVWGGLLITIVGAISYFTWAAQFADLRDFPILNLPIALLGTGLAGVGCVQVFKRGGGIVGKASAGIGFLLALGVAGMFGFYIFSSSAELPPAAGAPRVGTVAPAFTLPDENERPVQLADYRGKKVVLLFYRGFW